MGNRFTVTAGARTYEAVEDRVLRFDAFAVGAVTDEVTGRAPLTAVIVQTAREGAITKYLDHGAWCVAGDLERVLPGYPGANETFGVDLSAAGYRPASTLVTIAAGATLPVAAAAVALRPFPVRLEGRVTRSTLDPTAIAGGIVRIADRPGQSLVSLRTALHGPHPAGTAVRSVRLNPTGTERTLTAPAESAVATIALDDVTGLAGQVLGLDWQHRLEFAQVDTVDTAASTATLIGPLTRTYASGTRVRPFTVSAPPGPPPPVRTLGRDADAGDGLLQLNAAIASGTTAVQVGNAATPLVEYVIVGALTDTHGFYSFDGVGGVETIDLRARANAVSPEGPRFPRTLEYGQRINVVNLKLAP